MKADFELFYIFHLTWWCHLTCVRDASSMRHSYRPPELNRKTKAAYMSRTLRGKKSYKFIKRIAYLRYMFLEKRCRFKGRQPSVFFPRGGLNKRRQVVWLSLSLTQVRGEKKKKGTCRENASSSLKSENNQLFTGGAAGKFSTFLTRSQES